MYRILNEGQIYFRVRCTVKIRVCDLHGPQLSELLFNDFF